MMPGLNENISLAVCFRVMGALVVHEPFISEYFMKPGERIEETIEIDQ